MTIETRFREAFAEELRERPDVPPSPTRLARRMGWANRNLRGSVTVLRRILLEGAGFYKDENANRWYKR